MYFAHQRVSQPVVQSKLDGGDETELFISPFEIDIVFTLFQPVGLCWFLS
jgi:hypothetical protein